MDAKKRVLIVDDETNVRLVLTTALTSVGYAVSEAADGQAALDRLEGGRETFDLVLLDLLMPRMDGMELLRRMRAAGRLVPVVILTAHGSVTDAVAAMKLGAIDFLTKPITPEALRRTVAEVIERHRFPHEAAGSPSGASPQLPTIPRGSPSIWCGRSARSIAASFRKPGASWRKCRAPPRSRPKRTNSATC